jgi:hypothetical protein
MTTNSHQGIEDAGTANGAFAHEVLGATGIVDAEYINKFASMCFDTLPDESFAVVIHSDEGTVRRMPLIDTSSAKIAAVYLTKCADALPADVYATAVARIQHFAPEVVMRKQTPKVASAAAVVVPCFGTGVEANPYAEHAVSLRRMGPSALRDMAKVASANGADLSAAAEFIPHITEYTGDSFGTGFRAHVGHRKTAFASDELAQKVLDGLLEKTALRQIDADDAARVLHAFDQKFGDCGAPDAYRTVFANQRQKVAGFNILAHLVKNADKIKAVYGADVAKQLRDNPSEVYESLPRPMKDRIQRM